MKMFENLKISCWNINGYSHKGNNKYTDQQFLKNLSQHDIVCLLETHCNSQESLTLPDYKAVHLIRPKLKSTRKQNESYRELITQQYFGDTVIRGYFCSP